MTSPENIYNVLEGEGKWLVIIDNFTDPAVGKKEVHDFANRHAAETAKDLILKESLGDKRVILAKAIGENQY